MTDRELAEKLYRAEHPKSMPYSPWERQMELSDLWPADQEAYVRKVRRIRELTRRDP